MFVTFRAVVSLIALIGFSVFAIGLSAAVIIMDYNVAQFLWSLGVWIIVAGASTGTSLSRVPAR